jgi:hypothetical protein
LLREVLRETFTRIELHWTQRVTGKRTTSSLERGIIYMRPQRELTNLFGSKCAAHGPRPC